MRDLTALSDKDLLRLMEKMVKDNGNVRKEHVAVLRELVARSGKTIEEHLGATQ